MCVLISVSKDAEDIHKSWHKIHTQMLHGAGIFTYIYPKNGPVVYIGLYLI